MKGSGEAYGSTMGLIEGILKVAECLAGVWLWWYGSLMLRHVCGVTESEWLYEPLRWGEVRAEMVLLYGIVYMAMQGVDIRSP